MNKALRFGVVLLTFSVAACDGGVQQTLGLNREAPDEFTVVSRPPLSVPPEFTLRPPRPGEPAIGLEADQKARSLITGKDPNTTAASETAVTAVQSGEVKNSAAATLLKRAGADAADESIRDKLRADAVMPVDTSNAKTLLDQISGAEKNEPTVDAKKEAERLRSNKDSGKPVTEGEVPVEKSTTDSLIDRIF